MFARRYLSLKWKVMATVSLALLLASGLSIYATDATLAEKFEETRAEGRRLDGDLLDFLLGRAFADLRNHAEVFAGAERVHADLEDMNPARLSQSLAPMWDRRALGAGLEGMRVYARHGGLLARLGEVALEEATLERLAREALHREGPRQALFCDDGCYQAAAVPVLHGGESIGVVLLVRGMAGPMLEFHLATGADLALAKPGSMTRHRDYLPVLGGVQLLAMGGDALNRERLRRALESGRSSATLAHEGKHFEVYRAHTRVENSGAAILLVLRDVSPAKESIARARRAHAMLGAGVMLISAILLFFLLRPPLRRLAKLARLMPELGRGHFDEVRDALAPSGHAGWKDELTVLDDNTRALATRLQEMQAEASRHNDELSALVGQLSRERDFIGGVLDTARVLIVTQDVHGRIRMANAFTHEISGLHHGALIGGEFSQCLVMPDQAEGVRERVANIARGEEGATLRHEAILSTAGGELRDIVWQHSLLGMDSGHEKLVLSVGTDMTDVRLAEQRATYLAEFDELTGLLNRATFQRELGRMVDQRVIARGTLIVFDLDDFTVVNDLGGHAAGDQLLTLAAARIRKLSPAPLLAARLGSDDFALLFPELPAALAIQIARFIIRGMVPANTPEEDARRLSACAGITFFPDHGAQAGELLANADLAMTQAQAKGHGSWHVYSREDQTKSQLQGKAQALALIERGLHDGAFELHFQPIMRISDGSRSHFEALLRARDAEGKLVPPGLFIPVAEETGLIREVDRWVMRHAIAQLIGLNASVHLSVNLSARTLVDPDLTAFVRGLLHQSRITPARLIFEITETASVSDFEVVASALRDLRSLGCGTALDDFGAGFSSFQYLRQLPLDYVKIDGAFIRELDKNRDDQVFVRALTDAAHGYGKLAIAEFVENAAILDLLREYGVDFAQGYHIGKPSPALVQSGMDSFDAA